MTCPYHDNSSKNRSEIEDDRDGRNGGLDEESLRKAALVIGGASALSTLGVHGLSGAAAADTGSVSVAERQNRQHAWDAYELYNEDKETSIPPESQLLLNMDYEGSGTPDPGDRQTVEEALDKLEEAFGWGHEGLLFTIGYSPNYFARFDGDEDATDGLVRPDVLPRGLQPGLLDSQDLIGLPGVTLDRENPVADRYDAVLHLSSDEPENVLAAEQALWEGGEVNGVTFDAPFAGVFTKPEEPPDRRVGFVGHDTVSENLEKRTEFDDTKIPDDAVLSMGFNDLFRNSIPRETNATMLEDQRLVVPEPPGAFAQGSIQHLSKLDINLGSNVGDTGDGWYDDHDSEGRRKRMFSPEHTEENTGTVGEKLGNSNGPATRRRGTSPVIKMISPSGPRNTPRMRASSVTYRRYLAPGSTSTPGWSTRARAGSRATTPPDWRFRATSAAKSTTPTSRATTAIRRPSRSCSGATSRHLQRETRQPLQRADAVQPVHGVHAAGDERDRVRLLGLRAHR